MTSQTVLWGEAGYAQLEQKLAELGVRHLFVVCGGSVRLLCADAWLRQLPEKAGVAVTRFGGFSPNPQAESVARGTALFQRSGADAVLAVGGGSALDVGKCVKLFARADPAALDFLQPPVANPVPLLALPTTAGSGSEATRFAVIYLKGEKLSVTSDSILPSVVLLDPSVLSSLPPHQKKAGMLDALSHALESCWSLRATEQSRGLSLHALREILAAWPLFLAGEEAAGAAMLQAAHTAGQAINLAQTTAGHAMSYKLTSLYGMVHGHAAALCSAALFPWLTAHPECWMDPCGRLEPTLQAIAGAMGCRTPALAAERFRSLVRSLALPVPTVDAAGLAQLAASVNPVRLKNFPAQLSQETLRELYAEALLS